MLKWFLWFSFLKKSPCGVLLKKTRTSQTKEKVGLAKTQQNLSKASSSTFMSSEENKINIIETLNVLVLLVLAINNVQYDFQYGPFEGRSHEIS